MDFVVDAIGVIGGIFGTWALIRSYWLTRSHLVIRGKGQDYFVYHEQGGSGFIEFHVLVSNLSSQSNAVVQWRAWLLTESAERKEKSVVQGHSRDSKTKEVVDEFNVTPLNVPPHSTINAQIDIFEVATEGLKQPLEVELQATDMYGKRFTGVIRGGS